MNKKVVNDLIPAAIEALGKTKIAENGKIDKAFRGQISSFGAAISMGSFKAAVAFFAKDSSNEDSKVKRSKLLEAITCIRKKSGKKAYKPDELLKEENNLDTLKEEYIDAAIALKLAMNAFELVE